MALRIGLYQNYGIMLKKIGRKEEALLILLKLFDDIPLKELVTYSEDLN